MTQKQIEAAAKKLLKTSKIAWIQASLRSYDAVGMMSREQMNDWYVCKAALRLAAK